MLHLALRLPMQAKTETVHARRDRKSLASGRICFPLASPQPTLLASVSSSKQLLSASCVPVKSKRCLDLTKIIPQVDKEHGSRRDSNSWPTVLSAQHSRRGPPHPVHARPRSGYPGGEPEIESSVRVSQTALQVCPWVRDLKTLACLGRIWVVADWHAAVVPK